MNEFETWSFQSKYTSFEGQFIYEMVEWSQQQGDGKGMESVKKKKEKDETC